MDCLYYFPYPLKLNPIWYIIDNNFYIHFEATGIWCPKQGSACSLERCVLLQVMEYFFFRYLILFVQEWSPSPSPSPSSCQHLKCITVIGILNNQFRLWSKWWHLGKLERKCPKRGERLFMCLRFARTSITTDKCKCFQDKTHPTESSYFFPSNAFFISSFLFTLLSGRVGPSCQLKASSSWVWYDLLHRFLHILSNHGPNT